MSCWIKLIFVIFNFVCCAIWSENSGLHLGEYDLWMIKYSLVNKSKEQKYKLTHSFRKEFYVPQIKLAWNIGQSEKSHLGSCSHFGFEL